MVLLSGHFESDISKLSPGPGRLGGVVGNTISYDREHPGHAFATLMMRFGVNPKVVGEMMGHSTMDIYSHVHLELQRDAVSTLQGG